MNIERFLETHRCPQCGSRKFETLELDVCQSACCRPVSDADPDGPRDWYVSAAPDETSTDLMLGTIRAWCAGCGFLIWSIVPELTAAVLSLKREQLLLPADAEGRTTWAETSAAARDR